jgi:hypothetical protein
MAWGSSESSMGGASLGLLKSCPHLLQKLLSGGCVEPHFGQVMYNSIDEPHFLQKLESSGFSNWHFGHFIFDALQKNLRVTRFADNWAIQAPNKSEKIPLGAEYAYFEVFYHEVTSMKRG